MFNLKAYLEMLGGAKRSGYDFVEFSAVDGSDGPISRDNQKCLLRHDVDADVSAALTMAQGEYELGIVSTYFFMLRSPLYNLMARRIDSMVGQILALGHAVGLHYDQGFDVLRGLTPAQTSDAVENEVRWLENQFNTDVAAVSFHQPGPAILQGSIKTGTRINTYDRTRLAAFEYFSDSNRVFPLAQCSGAGIIGAIAACAPRNLQLLIHPLWWVYDDLSTEAVWERAIRSNLESMQQQLLETERAYGSARRFDISVKNVP